MFSAFSKAFGQLPDKTFRSVITWGIIGALLIFMLLITSVSGFLMETVLVKIVWVDTLIDILGPIATLGIVWLLFPAVASGIIGFLLDDIVKAVEDKHYPELPPGTPLGLGETIVEALKFVCVLVILNILALPLYLIPGSYLIIFYLLNGYLISREYFELVAQRRVGVKKARALRKAYQGKLLIAGACTAFLLTIPLVNLIAPVVGTAVMVHLFHSMRQEAKFLAIEQSS